MEEVLQALRASGLADEETPARYHRIVVLIAALIASEAGVGTITPTEHEQGMELFGVAVLGADPERFPALAHFARDVRPLRGGPPPCVRRDPRRPTRPYRGRNLVEPEL
jgi:hypothetical protein